MQVSNFTGDLTQNNINRLLKLSICLFFFKFISKRNGVECQLESNIREAN